MAAHDQQLVPTTRSQDLHNIAGNPNDFCLLTFFFPICIFYFKILK